jgi:para-nitrobenzyl esterase
MGEEKATGLIAAMKKAHPEKAIRTLSYGVQGLTSRNSVQRMVKLKSEQGGASSYQYFFAWQSPMAGRSGRGVAYGGACVLL